MFLLQLSIKALDAAIRIVDACMNIVSRVPIPSLKNAMSVAVLHLFGRQPGFIALHDALLSKSQHIHIEEHYKVPIKIKKEDFVQVRDCSIARVQDGLKMEITSDSNSSKYFDSNLPGTFSLSRAGADVQIAVKSVTIRNKAGDIISESSLFDTFFLGPVTSNVSLCYRLMDDDTVQSQEAFDDNTTNIAKADKYAFSTDIDNGGILTVEVLPVTTSGKAGMERGIQ